MSSKSWSESGIGCYTYQLKCSKNNFWNLITKANLDKELKKFIVETLGINEKDYNCYDIDIHPDGTLLYRDTEVNDYDDYFDTSYYGNKAALEFLALAISNELKEKTGDENTVIYCPSSNDGDDAILLRLAAPWYYKENNIKVLTQEEYEKIFQKWFSLYGVAENSNLSNMFYWVDVEQYG